MIVFYWFLIFWVIFFLFSSCSLFFVIEVNFFYFIIFVLEVFVNIDWKKFGFVKELINLKE